MRRTIQCNGIRTVGTIVRRFIQFVWQKIFTEDCDNDSKATSKFSFCCFERVSAHHKQTNERTNEQGKNQTTKMSGELVLFFSSLFSVLKCKNHPSAVLLGVFSFSFFLFQLPCKIITKYTQLYLSICCTNRLYGWKNRRKIDSVCEEVDLNFQ